MAAQDEVKWEKASDKKTNRQAVLKDNEIKGRLTKWYIQEIVSFVCITR